MGSITLICTSEQIKIHLDLLIALYLMMWTIKHPMYPPAISREHRFIWHLRTSWKLHYWCWNCCIRETSGLQNSRRKTVVGVEFYKMVWTASFNVISCQCQYFEKLTNEFRGGVLLLSSYILPLWISFAPLPEAVHHPCILVMLSTFQNILHFDLHFFFLFTKAFHMERGVKETLGRPHITRNQKF